MVMQKKNLSSSRMINLFSANFSFLLILLFPFILPTAHSKEFPIAGKDSLGTKVIEQHSQALLGWIKRDISNAILINFDAHDDMRWIDPMNVKALKEIKREKDWQAFKKADSIKRRGLYDIGSFIHAAHKLGIIRKVYWVIPFTYFEYPNPEKSLNSFLKDYGFSREDIANFVLDNGRYQGTCYRTPLVICDIESLPDIKEPILLTIDADFLPVYSGLYRTDMLTAVSRLFKRLQEKEYFVKDTTVSASVDGGYLEISRKWVVQVCEKLLSRPETINSAYPEKWLVYNFADRCYYNNQAEDLIDFIHRSEKKYSNDKTLKVYKAFGLLSRDKKAEAFRVAKEISRKDKDYAYLLADLGQCLIDKGNLKEGLNFFYEAYKLNPEMNYRQKNLADALFAEGQYTKAIYYYKVYARKNGMFPAAFTIGVAEMKRGNTNIALQWFNKGLDSLKREKYTDIKNEIDVSAIKAAAKYFRKKHEYKKTKLLINHPSFSKFFYH